MTHNRLIFVQLITYTTHHVYCPEKTYPDGWPSPWPIHVTGRLFVDLCKLTPEVKDHLIADECPNEKNLCVLLKPYKDITEAVKRLAGQKSVQILVSIAIQFRKTFRILLFYKGYCN